MVTFKTMEEVGLIDQLVEAHYTKNEKLKNTVIEQILYMTDNEVRPNEIPKKLGKEYK